LFTWRRLVAQGSLTAAGSGEEVVPASDYRALQNQEGDDKTERRCRSICLGERRVME
jgi:hypothetical protein